MRETIEKMLECIHPDKDKEFTLLLVELMPTKSTEILTISAEIIEMNKERRARMNVPVNVLICASTAFDTTLTELVEPDGKVGSRKREKSDARTAAMHYLRKNAVINTLQEIGRFFGGRDHATVAHAMRKHTAIYGSDPTYTKRYDHFISLLEGSKMC